MRNHPHCAGCDERIRWGRRTVKVIGRHDLWLFFHRRCLATWRRAQASSEKLMPPTPEEEPTR